MNAFIVELKNQKGEVARITEAIAHKGIDITGFAGVAIGDKGAVVLITNDEASTRKVLSEAHATVREVRSCRRRSTRDRAPGRGHPPPGGRGREHRGGHADRDGR